MNYLPVRPLMKYSSGDGAWIIEQKAEKRKQFKAVICALKRQNDDNINEDLNLKLVDEVKCNKFCKNLILDSCKTVDPSKIALVNVDLCHLYPSEEEFSDFTSVYKIQAAANYLKFDCFTSFVFLNELYLSSNSLKNIKIDPEDFVNLQILDVSFNELTENDLLRLGLLRNLKKLSLCGNSLKQLPSELNETFYDDNGTSWPRFNELIDLNLSNNNLTSEDTFSSLGGLKKLKFLNLSHNRISSIPLLRCTYVKGDDYPDNMFQLYPYTDYGDYGDDGDEGQLLDFYLDEKNNDRRIPSTLLEEDEESADSRNEVKSIKLSVGGSDRTITEGIEGEKELENHVVNELDDEKNLESHVVNELDEEKNLESHVVNELDEEKDTENHVGNVLGNEKDSDIHVVNEIEVEKDLENLAVNETGDEKDLESHAANEFEDENDLESHGVNEFEGVEAVKMGSDKKVDEIHDLIEEDDNTAINIVEDDTAFSIPEDIGDVKNAEISNVEIVNEPIKESHTEIEKDNMETNEENHTTIEETIDETNENESKPEEDVHPEDIKNWVEETETVQKVDDKEYIEIASIEDRDQNPSIVEKKTDEEIVDPEVPEKISEGIFVEIDCTKLPVDDRNDLLAESKLNFTKENIEPEMGIVNLLESTNIDTRSDGDHLKRIERRHSRHVVEINTSLMSYTMTEAIKMIAMDSLNRDSLTPFPVLEVLDLSNNRVKEEKGIISVITWVNFRRLSIHDNPLTLSKSQKSSFIKELLENAFKMSVDWLPPIDKEKLHPVVSKSKIDVSDTVAMLPQRVFKFPPLSERQSTEGNIKMELPKLMPVSDIISEGRNNEAQYSMKSYQKSILEEPKSLSDLEQELIDDEDVEIKFRSKTNLIKALKHSLDHPITYFDRRVDLFQKQAQMATVNKSTKRLHQSQYKEPVSVETTLQQQYYRKVQTEVSLETILSPDYYQGDRARDKEFKVASRAINQMQRKYNQIRQESLKKE